MTQPINLHSIQVDGIDMDDAFDFCDAFASSGKFEDGTPLTDQELEDFTDSDLGRNLIHRLACEECF